MPFVFQVGAGASQDRLENLIALRLQPDVNKEEIDARIWNLFGETWAIMFTDQSGFSRRSAAFGIIHFLQTIYESQRLLVPVIDHYDGILLKMDGDSMMVLFRSPANAHRMRGVHAAHAEAIQRRKDGRGSSLAVRIGVEKGSRPPLPPNRACGSPAHGSPVSGFLIGIGSLTFWPLSW